MAVSLATTRYVKALFAAAEKAGVVEPVRAELEQLAALFEGSAELRAALSHPRVPAETKKTILAAAGLSAATPLVQDFVGLCLDRGRPRVVIEAAEEFSRLVRDARGVVVARVQTVTKMSDEMRRSVLAKLEEVTGKTVELVEEEVPALLGGIRILIGSRMYDGSVRRRIDDLTAHLLSTRVGAGAR